MAVQELREKLIELKEQKSSISLEIKKLEETPKAKLSPVWMTLVYIFSIASVGVTFFNIENFIWAMALLILTVAAGVTQLLIVKSKNKRLEQAILKLKVEENRLITEIGSTNTKLARLRAEQETNQ